MIDLGIIIEPRNYDLLILVVKNVLNKIKTIKIHIFHGILNENLLQVNFKKEIINKNIILTNLNLKNLSIKEYNNYLTSVNFWNNLDGENILVFQIDSIICNYDTEFIKECCKYGFVGAPVKKWVIPWQNGGLSIRKKSLMIKAIKEKTENENFFPEDRYFTVVKKILVNPAPFKLANKFSVEKFYYEKPFGVHKFWEYLDQNMINKLLNNNKNLSLLKKYYLL
uniref:DUF5672 domain-containing protein n=1 Tax=viral metagenome TaxID=1070528 RepID=A0A6C0J884_9ZZZZ